jgi:hypothetical protein
LKQPNRYLVGPNTHEYFSARALILELEEGDSNRDALLNLESQARAHACIVAANNIAVWLAENAISPSDATKLYRDVAESQGDSYNQMRVSFKLVDSLAKQNQLGTMTLEERHLLDRAYAYGYFQRVTGFFDQAHEALWTLLKAEKRTSELRRLFRNSSFLWRIYGQQEKERRFLQEFVELETVEANEGNKLPSQEQVYIVLRIRRLLGNIKNRKAGLNR